jgi:alcohol dehydrogenase (quinone), cytochrome c subunit
MKLKSLILFAAAGGAACFTGVLAISTVLDMAAGAQGLAEPEATPALIARGEYLARLGDCGACHSVPGRPAFTGGLRMNTPIGAIYTTNITPDPNDGIGSFSLTDFDRALRFGVSKGHTLYPAMPYPSYSNTEPDDVAALYAYFKLGVTASATPNVTNEIPFPLSMRWPLTLWRLLFSPHATPFKPGSLEPLEARGAYFVDGLGHCGECHTARALTLQVKAQTRQDGTAYLSGAAIDNYFAPSLRTSGAGSLADWDTKDIADFLRTGANRYGIVFGSMTDVVTHSTQFMTDEDALATATYLKSIADPKIAAFAYNDAEHLALEKGDISKTGSLLYVDNCAACHRPDGNGYDRVFPRLAGNPVVMAPDATSLASIVLGGSLTPKTNKTPARFAMPAFAWRLDDQEVADVVTFIRDSWGNQGKPITAAEVTKLRKAVQPYQQGAPLRLSASSCPKVSRYHR